MKYILLIVLLSGNEIKTKDIKFNSLKACKIAAAKVKADLTAQSPNLQVLTTCMDKGLSFDR